MKISILDDNVRLAHSIEKFFSKEGHSVDVYNTRSKFMQNKNFDYDVYIIDIGLQDGNGLDIARYLRNIQQTEAPILVISGYQGLQTKLEGFEIGIDDYIIKPFSPLELQARIKSIMKKMEGSSFQKTISYANIIFDKDHRRVLIDGETVELSKKEKQILEFFMTHQDTFVSKSHLIESIRGTDYDPEKIKNTLNVSICKIRKKLGESFLLNTINSEGYILENEKSE